MGHRADFIREGQPGLFAVAAVAQVTGWIAVCQRADAEAACASGFDHQVSLAEADGLGRRGRGGQGIADIDVVDYPVIPEAGVIGTVGGVEGQLDLLSAVNGQVDGDGGGIVVPAAGLRGGVPDLGPGGSVVLGDFHVVVVFVCGSQEHKGVEAQVCRGRAVEGGCDQPFVLMVIIPHQAALVSAVRGIGLLAIEGGRSKAAPGGVQSGAVGLAGIGDGLGPILGREDGVFKAFRNFNGVGIRRLPGEFDYCSGVVLIRNNRVWRVSYFVEGDGAHVVVGCAHVDGSLQRGISGRHDHIVVSLVGIHAGDGEAAAGGGVGVVIGVALQMDGCSGDARSGVGSVHLSCHVHHGHRGHADVEGLGLILCDGYGPGGVHMAVGAEVDCIGVGQDVVDLILPLGVGDGMVSASGKCYCHAFQRRSARSGDGSVQMSHSAGDAEERGHGELPGEGSGRGHVGRIVNGGVGLNLAGTVAADGLGFEVV